MVARRDLPAILTARRELSRSCFAVELSTTPALPEPVPGQFVMLASPAEGGTFWRRAFSVAGYRRRGAGAVVELMLRVVGAATALWRSLPLGSRARILGPLGNGFGPVAEGTRLALVAGGIGLPPILFHLERLAGSSCRADLFLGATTASELLEPERCARAAAEAGGGIVITTDDGSAGRKGVVTAPLAERLREHRYDLVRACGPMPMLREVARLTAAHGVACELALEERMACGVGVCLGCVVPGTSGSNLRVCREGPVLPADAVDWEAV